MKKILSTLIIITIISCSENKLIDEKKMEEIITQALVSDAILNREGQGIAQQIGIRYDSIDIYQPILRRYGYTIQDFRYTVNTFAMRKSNPLDNIFETIAKDIEQLDAEARYRYLQRLKFDTLAMRYYADTVYTKNDTIRGSLLKYKFNIVPAKAGRYAVEFDYTSLMDNRVGSKSFVYEANSRFNNKVSNVTWLTKKETKNRFQTEVTLTDRYDSLKFLYHDQPIDTVLHLTDTTHLTNVKVIYYPPALKARDNYYYMITGFAPSIKEYYETKFSDQEPSSPIPFERSKPTPKGCSDQDRHPFRRDPKCGYECSQSGFPCPYRIP